jgi:uncharacterized membrane protein
MRLRTCVRRDRPADAPVPRDALLPSDPAVLPAAGDLELPAPARLALTAGWNLAESLGLPFAAYAAGERLGGQGLGRAAAAAMVWVTAGGRRVRAGSIPRLLVVSGLVLTLQAVLVLATGSVLLFLLQFPMANLALCVLFARTAPTGKPLVAQLAAEVVALRQPSAAHPGLDRFFRGVTWLWAGIFAASAMGLAVLLAVEPVRIFLQFTTVVTVAGVAAGTLLSVLWFTQMLRRCGLRIRFGQA